MKSKEELVLSYIGKLVKGTEFEGKTFLVGGAVRDEIMGKQLKDLDIVVSMPDGGIKFAEWITKKTNSFSHETNPLIFPRFGTAKFNFRNLKIDDLDLSDVDIEVVMTRGEKYTKGSRKPEVVYADIKDDAFRRDLTVNALYKDVVTGEVKDPTGMGIEDIKRGVVRTPTDPKTTFDDDPLRMLRVVRFAVKYNWKIPRNVLHALIQNADNLKNISHERIRDELNKILLTNSPDLGLKLLTKTGLNKHIIPELDKCVGVKQNEHHKHDVYNHILEVIRQSPPTLIARLSALFHDIAKPETKTVDGNGKVHFYNHEDVGADMAVDIMNRLKYSTEQSESVKAIVKNHMRLKDTGKEGENASNKQLRKFIVRVGDNLDNALGMMHADNISHKDSSSMPNQIKNISDKIQKLKQSGTSIKPTLPINGHDVMKLLNIKPGIEVKNMLAVVLDAWYENPDIGRDDALKLVKSAYEKQRGSIRSQSFDSEKVQSIKNYMDKKIRNPSTGNDILIKSALGYKKEHPAHKLAIKTIQGRRNK